MCSKYIRAHRVANTIGERIQLSRSISVCIYTFKNALSLIIEFVQNNFWYTCAVKEVMQIRESYGEMGDTFKSYIVLKLKLSTKCENAHITVMQDTFIVHQKWPLTLYRLWRVHIHEFDTATKAELPVISNYSNDNTSFWSVNVVCPQAKYIIVIYICREIWWSGTVTADFIVNYERRYPIRGMIKETVLYTLIQYIQYVHMHAD